MSRHAQKKYQLFSAKLLVFGPFLGDFYIREISTIVDTQTLAPIVMKEQDLKKLIKEIVIETFEEYNNPFHVIVIIDKTDKGNFNFLTEGQWRPSGTKDYWQRLDTPKFDHEQLHVHIAREKHINTKNKQVSWNLDGSRHDRKTFNTNFNGVETAKRIAKDTLGLPDNFVLENFNDKKSGELILETIEYLPSSSFAYIFYLKNENKKQLILS